jgi:sigma-B regulation protein RsbU (phosphoserine phosphatase)
MVGADGNLRWVHVNAKPFCDISGNESGTVISIRLVDHEVAAEQEAERARAARASIDARYRRLMESASVGMCITSLDGRFEVVNEALCDFLGYDSATLHTMTWSDVTPAEHRDGGTWSSGELVDRDQFRVLKQFVHADGHLVWGDVWASTLRDWTGRLESFIAQVVDVSEQVLDRHESARARRQQAEADLRYRRLTENSAIAICLIKPDGSFDMVNQAMCDFFGYDEAALRTKTWPELIPPDDVITDLQSVEEMLAGRIETYRLTKRYLHAEGRTMWGDLSVSCIRDDGGRVERFIAQIIDVTAEVEGRREILEQDESNRALTRKLQAQTDRLTAELNSAAEYIESLLPRDITGPPVRISSRYQPSDELAGDSHDYNWIDDDHLIVYLLDVSGHGVAAALLSISVHNMLRSASLPHDIMLAPDRLLGGLNQHFQMDRQGGNYFTMWYGVYQKSTRRLRYASAGHPPALMYGPGAGAVELSAEGLPIGMFDDAVFPTTNLGVAPGSRILLYSDGVYEWTLPDGRVWSVEEFIEMCERHAQSVGDWSLDTLVTTLRAQTPTETFEDDSSLVLLQFD